ncbi:MAG: hypothetical protein RL328_361 [Acidobacteriota bacterium]
MGQQNVAWAVLAALLLLSSCSPTPADEAAREALSKQSVGVVRLPSGDIVLSHPLELPAGAQDLEVRGSDSTRIVAGPGFQGKALIIVGNAKNVTFADFTIDGSRDAVNKPLELAPPENAFRVWYDNNGILADQVTGLTIERVTFRNVVAFPILVSRSSAVRIHDVQVSDSGSLDAKSRNNATGGIVLEEGTSDFEVRNSIFRNVRGNALWTHSLLTSPQLSNGVFAENKFERIGRDAIQVGHAKQVKVENNTGREVGYPFEIVDVEHGGTPVAVDTAGDVEGAAYTRNEFDEINGKCFDLDGFHDGVVADNSCVNRGKASDYPHGHFGIVMNNTNPNTHANNVTIQGNLIDGAKYGGLFLMGSNNTVTNNRFQNLNLALCNESSQGCLYKADEPNMLQAGIYIGAGVARKEPAAGNEIRGNRITGHKMSARCILAGPGVVLSANTVRTNICQETTGQ